MKYLIKLTALAFLFAATFQAYGQSLGELARKEKERREKIKAETKVITNNEAAKYRSGPITVTSLPAEATEKAATDKPESDAGTTAGQSRSGGFRTAGSDEPTDFQGRPESYWRQTMADARKRVQDLENLANVLILRINDLQNQFYRESDGFKQQAIQREIQKSFYEQDKNKEDLANAKAQLQELEKEGRKSGALPGWLEGKRP